ncbi:N-6 DNA methylase [Dactylosporangium sp. NPDC049742]|uniref:N-6 DNA methylase n=1 Tax=Dactylosporangium sp. NPDC049742 TaxID=3154737 RepID=UPI0034421B4E
MTPDELADLMVSLAQVDGGTVLDPTAGAGGTLRAVACAGCSAAFGQELREPFARLATPWLALCDVPGEVMTGDSLRSDAFSERHFDAVVCHPPFVVTSWGQDNALAADEGYGGGVNPGRQL